MQESRPRLSHRPRTGMTSALSGRAMAGSVGVLPFVDYYVYATGEAPVVVAPANGEPAAAASGSAAPGRAETRPASAYPIPNTWRSELPNNHLSYAITWFALAVALLVIYLVYHARPGSREDRDRQD